jgi:hypothetical protein
MRRGIDRTRRRAIQPLPANIGILLDGFHSMASGLQALDCGKTCGTGADDEESHDIGSGRSSR